MQTRGHVATLVGILAAATREQAPDPRGQEQPETTGCARGTALDNEGPTLERGGDDMGELGSSAQGQRTQRATEG